MNERIQELAREAKLGPALLLHHWNKFDALTDSEQEALEQIEKFAELIVRECMACSTWVGKVNENVKEPGPMHTAHAINQRIKKHFGVEE